MRSQKTINYKMLASLFVMLAYLVTGAAHAQQSNTVTTVTYFLTDAQGNVLATTDAQGNITARYTYRPYGAQQSGPTNAGPGYTGHVNDPDTGLVYMQQRYYDPDIGRFISPDPIRPTPGNIYNINRYVYAADNPIRYTDPDGRCIDGVTCGSMLSNHVEWRLSHPNAPPDVLEKGAFVAVGAMASATGGSEAGSAVSFIRTIIQYVTRKTSNPEVPKKAGSYRPSRTLPRDKHGNPVPDTNAPHTQIGTKSGRNGDYTQAREWGHDANGKLVPKRDIDFTDHGRPETHPNPHQHDYTPNPSGGTLRRSREAKPLEYP